jgi:hypothetical protein
MSSNFTLLQTLTPLVKFESSKKRKEMERKWWSTATWVYSGAKPMEGTPAKAGVCALLTNWDSYR